MIRRLYFDLETAPNIGFFWQTGYQINVGYESIITERAIICVSYKFSDEKKAHTITWDRNQSDKKLLKKFIPIMSQADEVVAHNGDNFDIKWLRARAIKHGVPMPPAYVSIDTLKLARSGFKFNSNTLDYIAKYFGLEGKIKTDYSLWKDIVLKKDAKALKKMVKYCEQDVFVLEKVWERMNQYVKPRSKATEYDTECPECGGSKLRIQQRSKRASGMIAIQFHCQGCGKYFSIPDKKYTRALKKKEVEELSKM